LLKTKNNSIDNLKNNNDLLLREKEKIIEDLNVKDNKIEFLIKETSN